jgi:hypothetical protein
MRRIGLLAAAAALLAPQAAFAFPGSTVTGPGSGAGSGGSGQASGSLAVNGVNGTIFVEGQGVIFGYVDQGSLLILSYRPVDPSDTISVENARERTDPGLTSYIGSGVRFLLPAGRYSLEIIGSGIDVSAVGSGVVNATGAGTSSDGWIAFDGGQQLSVDRVGTPRGFGASG